VPEAPPPSVDGASADGPSAGADARSNRPPPTPRLLRRPPSPDHYTYSLALDAFRAAPATSWAGMPLTCGEECSASGGSQGGAARGEAAADWGLSRTIETYDQLTALAEAAVGLPAMRNGSLPEPLLQALSAACATEADAALAVWKGVLLPALLKGRPAADRRRPWAKMSKLPAYHALLAVCGYTSSPRAALALILTLRSAACAVGPSCWAAYSDGQAAASAEGLAGGEPQHPAYEKLLQMECTSGGAVSA